MAHGPKRRLPKQVEKLACMSLVKNGKFFLPPPQGNEDFKTLFARVAAAGVGRPVEKDGCPQGPWTAELLAEAISQIDANSAGIELRTVQLWFEDNDKGISATNVRWLAKVLGCNDPRAASDWQIVLSAAQSRLVARRRARRRGEDRDVVALEDRDRKADGFRQSNSVEAPKSARLAQFTEMLFAQGSVLSLPAAVFAGAVALQFISYFLSVHSVSYLRETGVEKEVGFLWAPNWTVLFILFLPLFLAIVVDQVVSWKSAKRDQLLGDIGKVDHPGPWMKRVESSSYTFWAVFVICVAFAGIFQWVSVRLLPLLNGGGNHAVDWGSLALVRPEKIGILEQAAFTGSAYLYMSLCFYLLGAGLILLSILVDDFVEIRAGLTRDQRDDLYEEADAIGARILKGVARCAIAGLLIASCMKLQSLYLLTSAPNIWDWLVSDMRSVLIHFAEPVEWGEFSSPTSYTSLIVAFLVSAVYLYAMIRIVGTGLAGASVFWPTVAVALLAVVYLLIGMFPGFSMLLGAGLIVAAIGLFDPDFGFRWKRESGGGYVS